jgi:hypothetical protein
MDPCSDAASPWWLGAAASIIVGLVGAVGKMWAVIVAQRAELAATITKYAASIDGRDADHKRDLRHVIGWWSKPPAPADLLRTPPSPPPLPDPVGPPRPREPRRPKKPP